LKGGPERILVIYSWPRLWSMGPGKGSPDFYLSLKSLVHRFAEVVVVCPTGKEKLPGAPQGVETAAFRWPGAGRLIAVPLSLKQGGFRRLKAALRAGLFAINWVIRLLNYGLFTVAAYRAGRRAAAKHDPAIVAAYGYMAVPAARLLSARLGLPLVIRLFGVSLGLKGFSIPAQLAQFEETLSFRLGAERWVITDDGSGGDTAARSLGVPGRKVVHLLSGVDRTAAAAAAFDRSAYRRRLGLSPQTRVILRTARLWRQQRIDRMIRLMPRTLQDGTAVAAVVAGVGPEQEYLEKLAATLGAKVLFVGALDHEQLIEHYRCADLYVATSDRTNLSNSVLEALCHGLPVVALATGRTGDIVADGVNGRLLPLAEQDRLTGVIENLLNDEELRRKLSLGALRTAGERIPDFESRMAGEARAFSLEFLQEESPGKET